MKLTIHQKVALSWLVITPVTFASVVASATRADAGVFMAWGVAMVAVMVLTMPTLLRWPVFRRWYAWTDALSERQRLALSQRNLSRYYQTGFEDGYLARVIPYFWRLTFTVFGLMALTSVLPSNSGLPALGGMIAVSVFYLMGVMFVVIASWPISQLIDERCGRRS